jgi:hypothetical protein
MNPTKIKGSPSMNSSSARRPSSTEGALPAGEYVSADMAVMQQSSTGVTTPTA